MEREPETRARGFQGAQLLPFLAHRPLHVAVIQGPNKQDGAPGNSGQGARTREGEPAPLDSPTLTVPPENLDWTPPGRA